MQTDSFLPVLRLEDGTSSSKQMLQARDREEIRGLHIIVKRGKKNSSLRKAAEAGFTSNFGTRHKHRKYSQLIFVFAPF
jgi:hypothetical protein